jgi:phage shock protein PspC (stress-responsive transcriptional regulator)
MENKRLFRSRTDRKIAGVCGGLAVRFNVDSTIIRLAWAICTFFSAGVGGILAYIVCVVIIPEE